MKEKVDYEIIPDQADEQAWNVRILTGPYTETVIKYGTVKFNEIPKNMSFNFDIVSSPDESLSVDDIDLQDFVGLMLEKIMVKGIEEGSVITKEVENGKDN